MSPLPPIVTPDVWQAARDSLLAKEKAATRALDALAAERRRLPMTPFSRDHVFTGPDGQRSLLDLFGGRRQLVIYQMMDNGPDDYCTGCACVIDSVGHLSHLHARDTGFAVVSDMPMPQLAAYWRRMGWSAPVYSSRGSSFSTDIGAGGGFALSVLLRDGDEVYRTYVTTARGVDRLRFDLNILDLTPYGRQETWEDSPAGRPQTPPYEWWRLHDEYPATTEAP
ncbi:DUF899 domain-containing protein [Jiangella sp. DSM 45060]|uniref:DUF899 domain-containing protein n=1 Tax=Jiangella sp. DSM 45060 TaxID=1798224 RepID=UPI00087D9A5C|nr:DUF899 domain-containing protein [Jiangella sp. DSM 45060]SDT58417.1 Predicted dithiol-disulfide oxidoreductase, DUF899 family [Jiangella sp. DSM 45060]